MKDRGRCLSPQARSGLRPAESENSRSSSPKGRFTFSQKPRPAESGGDFVAKAIERNVLIIPGNVFSERDTHFRISYATSDEKLEQGCEILLSMA